MGETDPPPACCWDGTISGISREKGTVRLGRWRGPPFLSFPSCLAAAVRRINASDLGFGDENPEGLWQAICDWKGVLKGGLDSNRSTFGLAQKRGFIHQRFTVGYL